MKKWLVLVAAILLLSPLTATAGEGDYIVKLKNTTAVTLSADAPPFILLSDLDEIKQYDAYGLIEYYEPDLRVQLYDTYTDPYYSQQWSLPMLGIPTVWNAGFYGKGVTIGVVDSGLYPHTDIIANTKPGYNYLDNSTNTSDTVGHGTGVSGIIAASANNIGMVGGAYHATIVPLKCFDNTDGYVSDVALAIRGAVDTFDCDIINMSFGVSSPSTTLEQAVIHAQEKGAVIIAASGNSGTTALSYPAAYAGVIGVGSVTQSKTLSYFSQYNTSVDVVAPGSSVLTLNTSGSYATRSGTSFSAPQISAIAALLLDYNETLSAAQITAALTATAEDLGTTGYDVRFGYGLANASAAQSYVQTQYDSAEISTLQTLLQGNLRGATFENIGGKYHVTSLDLRGYTLSGAMDLNGLAHLVSVNAAGTDLTTLCLPDTIIALPAGAFSGCDALRSVTFMGNAPAVTTLWGGNTDVTVYRRSASIGWGTTLDGCRIEILDMDEVTFLTADSSGITLYSTIARHAMLCAAHYSGAELIDFTKKAVTLTAGLQTVPENVTAYDKVFLFDTTPLKPLAHAYSIAE